MAKKPKKPAGKAPPKRKGKKAALVAAKKAAPLTKAEVDHKADVAVAHLNVYADDLNKKVLQIGDYLFDDVFGGSLEEARQHDRSDNPVWLELKARAEGTLQLNESSLSRALGVACANRFVEGGAWKVLDAGRKIDLLPLKSEALLREGAQHAIDWNLGRRKLRAWVRVKLGPRAQVRETSERYESFVGTAATRLSDPRRIDKVVSDLEGKPPESRQRLIDELEKLEAAAKAALKRLKGR